MNAKIAASQSPQLKQQNRSIWLTVIGCLVFITILLGLFFNKISTPRYLSTVELRINGLMLLEQPQLLSALPGGQDIAKQLPRQQWSLLIIQRGSCGAVCVERLVPVVSMLNQLPSTYREKTQLVLFANDTAELLQIINQVDQQKSSEQNVATIAIDSLQQQGFEEAVGSNKVIIVDDSGYYRGYFAAPFDDNKLLLTYSSVLEHR